MSIKKKIGIASAATLFTLVSLELAWRFWYTNGFGPTTNPHYVLHDPELGWVYAQKVIVRHVTEDFNVEIRISSEGERGEDDSAGSKRERARIWLLGDSLAFGWGVDGRDGVASVLEDTTPFIVRNLAVSGYGTDQEYLRFKREARSARPRAVVVIFCNNDIEEVLSPTMYGKSKPLLQIENGRLAVASLPGEQTLPERASFLYRSIRKRILDARAVPPSAEDVARGKKLILMIYREMARIASEIESPLVVVHAGADWIGEGLAAEKNIYVLDVAPALASAAADGPVVFAHDPHWNERGHRAVGNAIAELLNSRVFNK
ncbi:MAG: SGNH/GDSL hydrolase family protein [Planctomycetes bacterium]|nr:SGNH/GDSL hydrolase family protein [Planctomycetota bacterium]